MPQFNFPPTSRYYGLELASLEGPNGPVAYLKRRFVPSAERFALLQLYTVAEGERLDHIAAKTMGDAEAFWRIADANSALRPEALTETPGTVLRITLPEGLPGASNA